MLNNQTIRRDPSTASALPAASPDEDVVEQGSFGATGATGATPGGDGQVGQAGGEAVADAASTTGTTNTAEATGGQGGFGGEGGTGGNGGDGGNGGAGGDAFATAAVVATSATGNTATATATATGGVGGTGGGGVAPHGLNGLGGAGGNAVATASATNAIGAASATANAFGGSGGEPPNGGIGIYFGQPDPAVVFGVGGAAPNLSGSSATASGTTQATAVVDQVAGTGGDGAIGGAGGGSTLVDDVAGQTAGGLLNLIQTAIGGSGGYGGVGSIAGNGGSARSDLTLTDTSSATVSVAVTATAGDAGLITAVGGGQIEAGAGGDATALGNIIGAGRVLDQVESHGGDGGATGGDGSAVSTANAVTFANAYASTQGGAAESGRGGDATAVATAIATGPSGTANATAAAVGGVGLAANGNVGSSGTADATASATGSTGSASATAGLEAQSASGHFNELTAVATAPVAGTSRAVATAAESGTLDAIDTTAQAVSEAILAPTAGLGGLSAGPGDALLLDTEQGGGDFASITGSVTITSDVSAQLDLSPYAAGTDLTLDLAGAILVGTGVTGVTLQVAIGQSNFFKSFSSGADALAYFDNNLIDLGEVGAVTSQPANTDASVNMTVTVDAANSGFYADPLFAEGAPPVAAAPCFAAGTRITTTRGEVAVEDLRIGDEVATLRGQAPIIWIGHRRVFCAGCPKPELVNPVRIRAHAFGDVPTRDLLISPDHALWIEGELVPAHVLLNGDTIVQEARDIVVYFHIELERHGVLFAEGLPAESYLDTGNRSKFANAPLLDPTRPPEDPCAPMAFTANADVTTRRRS